MMRFGAALVAVLALTWPAAAQPAPGSQLLYLAEDVPAGLDYDGPSVSVNTSQVGFINLMEPLIYYPYGARMRRASAHWISAVSRGA